MKKTLITMLALLWAAPAFAGTSAPLASAAPAADAEIEAMFDTESIKRRYEREPYIVTIQGGMMHTDADYYNNESKLSNTPSILYGVSIGIKKHVAGNGPFSHTVGFSTGYYSGSENYSYSWITDGSWWSWDEKSHFETQVSVIPIMLSYNLEYEVSEKLYIFGGLRGGAFIRTTDVSNTYIMDGSDECRFDDSSTKIVPMMAVGVGVRTYISERLSFEISYDFGWSFTNDCDKIRCKEYGECGQYLSGTGQTSRYFGTVSGGFSYSF